MEKHASILYRLHDPGDGPPSTPEQLAAESELCKAEKQQRAEKCNQRHATPVPCIKWPHDNWFCSKPFEMWKKCGKWTRGFLYKSLACNSSPWPCHLDRVKGQSTFNLNFKEGCFSLHGENLTLLCWVKKQHTESALQWNHEKLLFQSSLWGKIDTCTMEKILPTRVYWAVKLWEITVLKLTVR